MNSIQTRSIEYITPRPRSQLVSNGIATKSKANDTLTTFLHHFATRATRSRTSIRKRPEKT